MELSSAMAIQAGAVVLTIMIMGIILGYTSGISIDLANGISDANFRNLTVNYIVKAGGYGILQFNFLTAIALVAFAVLVFFLYAGRSGGEGSV